MIRWGLSFSRVPFKVAAKELYATLFRLEPVNRQIMMGTPPEAIQPYVAGERWREYYSPSYDRVVLWSWMAAIAFVAWRVVRDRLWRRDRDPAASRAVVVGLWALPPSIVLFVFYARVGNMVTRYLVDLYPAYAATFLCLGMGIVDALRKRAPSLAGAAQVALAACTALYLSTSGWRGWPANLAPLIDQKRLMAQVADLDAHMNDVVIAPKHFKCGDPHGRDTIHEDRAEWRSDCTFNSAMTFAMTHAYCVSFTLLPASGKWGPLENESLAGFRATGDSDPLKSCGPPTVDGDARIVTMCDPHPPPYLLDGMRLYAVASLDENLNPIRPPQADANRRLDVVPLIKRAVAPPSRRCRPAR